MSSVIAEPCVDHMDQERIDADPASDVPPGQSVEVLDGTVSTPRGMGSPVSRPIIEGLPWARRRSRVRSGPSGRWQARGPSVARSRWIAVPVLGVGRCSGWAMRTLTRDTNTSRMA